MSTDNEHYQSDPTKPPLPLSQFKLPIWRVEWRKEFTFQFCMGCDRSPDGVLIVDLPHARLMLCPACAQRLSEVLQQSIALHLGGI